MSRVTETDERPSRSWDDLRMNSCAEREGRGACASDRGAWDLGKGRAGNVRVESDLENRSGWMGLPSRGKHKARLGVGRPPSEPPSELIHVDVKKLAGIPYGGGWRTRGRGYAGEGSPSRFVGYRYLHTAIDDRTRIVYSEILTDEKADTAAGFWRRAAAWFGSLGITCERVITDNGSCYRSGRWYRACQATGTAVKKTRPYRPQTNGKVERFHRILLEEWAYIRPWTSETQRTHGYAGFLHFYNHHRPHGALGWATPTSTLQDNLPAEHS